MRPAPPNSRRISAAPRSTAPWATITIVSADEDSTMSVIAEATRRPDCDRDSPPGGATSTPEAQSASSAGQVTATSAREIGRASCRERVEDEVVADPRKKKTH